MNTAIKSTNEAFNADSYNAAMKIAETRANHSFFDQQIIGNEDGTYSALDQGDYAVLPQEIVDRIVFTVEGRMSDDIGDAPVYGFISSDFDAFDRDEIPY